MMMLFLFSLFTMFRDCKNGLNTGLSRYELGQIWGELGQIWGELGQIWGELGQIWGELGQIWGETPTKPVPKPYTGV